MHRLAATLSTMALAAVALSGLPAAPAQAAPVFVDADTTLTSSVDRGTTGAGCSTSLVSSSPPVTTPVVENGSAAQVSSSVSATIGNTVTPADSGSGQASATVTGRISSRDGNLEAIDVSASGSAQLTTALQPSSCTTTLVADAAFEVRFLVTRPGFLTFTSSGSGLNALEISLGESGVPQHQIVDNASGFSSSSTRRVFLPAGDYAGHINPEVALTANSTTSGAGAVTVHGAFTPIGAQTVAAAGKGGKYVTLPAARSCAAHAATVTMTHKGKLIRQIAQVKLFVNGTLVKKTKHLKKGSSFALPVPDGVTGDLRAEVRLVPRHPGHKPQVVDTTASYEACG